MKDEIIKLRNEGKSYNQIKIILGCSKSTISYHCGEGQKLKSKERLKKLLGTSPLLKKIDNFKNRRLSNKTRDFQRKRDGNKYSNERVYDFTQDDVINKISKNPICYLSGEQIDISDTKSYHFDHIIPLSKGGDNTLKNLGITTKSINRSKSDLTIDEFIELCKTVLIYNGYKVSKK